MSQYDYGWALIKDKPVGIIFGHHFGPFMVPTGLIWFPWATTRNKLECSVAWLNTVRKHMESMIWSDDKDFWTHMAKYGIVRRIGTAHIDHEPLSVWQTRRLSETIN